MAGAPLQPVRRPPGRAWSVGGHTRRALRGVQRASGRLFVRLVAGILLITVAVMSAVVVVLTERSSSALTSSTEAHLEDLAQSATSRLDAWVLLAQSQLPGYAEGLSTAAIPQAGPGSVLDQYKNQTESTFGELDLVSDQGELVASTTTGSTPSYPAPSALGAGGLGATILPVEKVGDTVAWYAYIPLNIATSHFTGYLVGDINAAADLTQVFDTVIATTSSPIVVQAVAADHRLIFSSAQAATTSAAMVASGTLTQVVQTPSVDAALQASSRSGALSYGEGDGASIAGYAYNDSLGWAITATEASSIALASVSTDQALAALMLVVGVALLAVALIFISFRITRPIDRMATAARSIAAGDLSTRVRPTGTIEVATLGDSFNTMVESLVALIARVQKASAELGESASRLSAASAQLVSTTVEQSASATETSASMGELARTSARIAESIDHVATRASLTEESLLQAQEEIRTTSERTLALSQRVRDIMGIMAVIQDIATGTNLLALNATIEAARAGSSGRGFAAVADEVRRLADKTKQLSAQIAEISRGAQVETAATVMAMEKGVTQLDSGLRLMEEVAEATVQVRHAAAEQRSASEYVVDAMEKISASIHQLSATSQEMAATASSHSTMARDLEEAASISGRSVRA